MTRALYINFFTFMLMSVACSSEAKTPKNAARAYAPIGDLMFMAMRDVWVVPHSDIKNRVPDSKILYDVQNVLVESGLAGQVRVEVRDQIVFLKGSVASGMESDTLEQGIQRVFGVRSVINELELR